MAQRRDLMLEELRRIRSRISKRLLEAERREGTCLPELRKMEQEAVRMARRDRNGTARNGNGRRR